MKYESKMVLLADKVGKNYSKDPSTKIGAVICEDGHVLTYGYNGLPRGIKEDVKSRIEREFEVGGRPLKYSWFEHGERNAIYNIARNAGLFQGKVLLVNSEIDIEDLRCAVSAGIEQVIFVVYSETDDIMLIEDEHSNAIAMEMIDEAKMKTYIIRKRQDHTEQLWEIQKHKNLIAETGLKAEKIVKKIELLEIYSDLFAQDYGLKGVDDKVFKTTKGAALIFDKVNYTELANSCTGLSETMLNNVDDTDDVSMYTLGAIRNTIYSAIYPLLKNKEIFVNLCPCIDCAKAIVNVGIKKTTYLMSSDLEVQKRWEASFKKSENYLKKFKVESIAIKL